MRYTQGMTTQQAKWIVTRQGSAVAMGFWGDDPNRYWCDADSPSAKTWHTQEAATRWAHSVGDSSWGFEVVAR